MTKLYILTLLLSVSLLACKTASKSYQKGNYADALELGLKKLQKDPYDRNTLDLVKSAYNNAVDQHQQQIRSLSAYKEDSRYGSIFREYEELQRLYTIIHQYPSFIKDLNPSDYSDYLNTYGTKAVEYHTANAEKMEAQATKTAYREAYNQYKEALYYQPNNMELKKKRDEAYDAAVTKILVTPIQNYGHYNYYDRYQLDNFEKEIMRTLAYNLGSSFVRFYSDWDLRSRNMEPDQVMELNLDRTIMGQPYNERSSREVSKQVVVKEIVYKPDSIVKEYGSVHATITTTKRNILSQADLYITLRDSRGRILWNDRFTGAYRWQNQFVSYTGDERALSDADKSLLKNQKQMNNPREEEIMSQLYTEIQNELSRRLQNYYNRY
jgi:hypothetical protein